jgi:hypothetical protein
LRKTSVILVSIAGLFSVVAAEGAQSGTLSSEAKRIHDYLLGDWSKHMHSTDIALAMENLGMEPSEDIRMELGEYFRENKHLANNLKWWGPNNYILSSEEKRIAKQIINTYELEQRLPSIQELAEHLGISAERLEGRLAFMKRAGLLMDASEGGAGYALADKYARWGGPLRYNFHHVIVGDGKPFGVW